MAIPVWTFTWPLREIRSAEASATELQRVIRSIPSFMDFLPEPDMLFQNNGDGTFTDISMASGIGAHAGTGMGMVCADIDLDADLDIFVLNDVAGNFIFINDGRGHF